MKRFQILKYVLHIMMVSITVVTLTQISFMYTKSDFAGTNPMDVSVYDFVKS